MKIKKGDLIRVISCYANPELKGQMGIFLGKVSNYNKALNSELWFYKVLCTGGKIVKLIKNDLEVINESKSNET